MFYIFFMTMTCSTSHCLVTVLGIYGMNIYVCMYIQTLSDELQQMSIKIKLSLVFESDVLRSAGRLQPIPHSDVYSLQA
jgi:hypothetical protein